MVFEKPSLRTRVSFEVGMGELGGRALYLSKDEVGLGQCEAVEDVARVLSLMCTELWYVPLSRTRSLALRRMPVFRLSMACSTKAIPVRRWQMY